MAFKMKGWSAFTSHLAGFNPPGHDDNVPREPTAIEKRMQERAGKTETKTRRFLGREWKKTKKFDESGKKIGKKVEVTKGRTGETKFRQKGDMITEGPVITTGKGGTGETSVTPKVEKPKVEIKPEVITKTEMSFGDAFKAARKAGKKEFTWKGKKYHTRTKEEEEKKKKEENKPDVVNRSGKFNWFGEKSNPIELP